MINDPSTQVYRILIHLKMSLLKSNIKPLLNEQKQACSINRNFEEFTLWAKVIVLASTPKNKINHELIHLLWHYQKPSFNQPVSGKVTATVSSPDKPAAMKKPVQWWNDRSQASCCSFQNRADSHSALKVTEPKESLCVFSVKTTSHLPRQS